VLYASGSTALYGVCLAGALALSIYPLVSRRKQDRPGANSDNAARTSVMCWSSRIAGLWFGLSSRSAIYLVTYFKTSRRRQRWHLPHIVHRR